MTLPIITDVFRVAFNYTGTAGHATNVMHFRNSTDSPATIAADIDAKVTSTMWSFMPNTSKLDSVDITPLDGVTPTYTLTGINQLGNTDGQPVPAVCAVLSLRTAVRGRSSRGRLYLPWVSENVMNAGVLDGTVQGVYAAAWDTFFESMITSGSQIVVASYKLASAEDVINIIANPTVATQRRRQQRVG